MPEDMTNNSGSRKKGLLVFIGIIAVIGLIGGGWWLYQSTKYISTDDARISGTLISASSKIPGRVSEVLVKEGDQVKAGQVIVRLDTQDILAQKAQAEAALLSARARYDEVTAGARPQEIEQARASLNQAQSTLENASSNYERMKSLYSSGAISAQQLDSASTAFAVAREAATAADQKLDLTVAGAREETVRAAAAQVKQAEAALQAIQVTLDNATITAAGDGTVVQKTVNPGENVAAGQPLFTIADLKDVWVSARIEETKVGKLKVGQPVEYTIDAYPGQTFSGTVYEISGAANSVFALIPTENSSSNFTKVTQRIPIKITLPVDSGVVFRPGMSVITKIHIG